MRLSLFDYNLPPELIAQKPMSPRDHSRLLVYDKKTKKITHDHFFNLPKYLKPNDVLVFNNSKVIPARLIGKKASGGKAEILLLKNTTQNEWQALIGTKNPKPDLNLLFDGGLIATVIKSNNDKTWQIKFNKNDIELKKLLFKYGKLPIPPYIKSNSSQSTLTKQYQTVYAKTEGSSAAPTAGLHFTKKLLNKIKKAGCQIEFVTLHVGLGTFNPVNTNNIEDYKIHHEFVQIDQPTINRLKKAKQNGQRIIAVGTTSVRSLEAVLGAQKSPEKGFADEVGIFIYPGYKFKFVDAMITNFHLPKSSLLMLVSAFIDRTTAIKLYKFAIKLKYRFFSFGDAMFLG